MKIVVDAQTKTIRAEQFFEKKVAKFSKSGHITVPRGLVGRIVLIVVPKKKIVSIQEVKSKL